MADLYRRLPLEQRIGAIRDGDVTHHGEPVGGTPLAVQPPRRPAVAEQSHSDDELRKRISELKKQVASLQRRVQALQDELEREIEDGNEQAKLVMQLVAEVRALRGEGSDGSES